MSRTPADPFEELLADALRHYADDGVRGWPERDLSEPIAAAPSWASSRLVAYTAVGMLAVIVTVVGLSFAGLMGGQSRSGAPRSQQLIGASTAVHASAQPLASAGPMPPAPRINGVAGTLGSYCWTFRGAALAQAPKLMSIPSPIPSDFQSHFCADATADFARFAAPVSAPLHLWLPNVRANVTASVQDQNGNSGTATLNADGSVELPAGTWTTLMLAIQWPSDQPNISIGDAQYGWGLR
jgi:hypothetical protein